MSNPKVFFYIMIGQAKAERLIMDLFADVKTSVASSQVRNGIGSLANACTTRALSFTGLSQISCAKVGISPEVTELVVNLYMVGSLRMKTSPKNTLGRESFQWLMPDQIQWFSVFHLHREDSWLDGNHVVFVQVIDGYSVVKAMEKVGSDGGDFFTCCDHRRWRHKRDEWFLMDLILCVQRPFFHSE